MRFEAIPADLNLLSSKIIGLAIKVHYKIGTWIITAYL